MEVMENGSIYSSFDDMKADWLNAGDESILFKKIREMVKRIGKQEEKRKRDCEKFCEYRKKLKTFKSQNPEEIEQLYWDVLTCVKRNNIFQDTVYGKMLPFVALCISVMSMCVSAMSMIFSVVSSSADVLISGIILCIIIFVGGFISIIVFGFYIWPAMDTREISYYEIMLSILEDLRNAQEEALSEEKPRKYVVAVQSCSQEDRPASTYHVIIHQRKKE